MDLCFRIHRKCRRSGRCNCAGRVVAWRSTKLSSDGGTSKPSRAQRCKVRSPSSAETSRDQPCAVLKAMTRTGLEYCPSTRSVTTACRAALSSSVSRQARPSRSPNHPARRRHRDRRAERGKLGVIQSLRELRYLRNSKIGEAHSIASRGTCVPDASFSRMNRYFFDFRSGEIVSTDDEGRELPDMDCAHREALQALGDTIQDVVLQGKSDQQFAVEVRDDLGPVLEVTAVLGSRILRKQ